jgi:CBS domain-containing protein
MLAREIMTSPVKTITLTTPVAQIAALLAKANISGVPVVDKKGGLLGIVSEADLLRHAAQGGAADKWWLAGLSNADEAARLFAKAHGRVAADVMTRHVATVQHDATIAEVAEALASHGVKRLPVMREGALAGIITRRDLVRALAKSGPQPTATLGNAHLQRAVLERMGQERWLDASYIHVVVRDEVVELSGYVASAEQKRAVEALVGELDQKRRLINRLEIGLPLVSDFA